MLSWCVLDVNCDPLFPRQQLIKLHEIGEIAYCTELRFVPEDIYGRSNLRIVYNALGLITFDSCIFFDSHIYNIVLDFTLFFWATTNEIT